MRLLAPRPVPLALTLILVVGAIAFIELRFNTADEQGAAAPAAQQGGKSAKGAQLGVASSKANW